MTPLWKAEAEAHAINDAPEQWYSTNRAARRQHRGPRRLTARGRANRARRIDGQKRRLVGDPERANMRWSRRWFVPSPGYEVIVLAPAGIGAKHYRLARAQQAERDAAARAATEAAT